MTTKEQMLKAKAHIQLEEYDKARKILATVDHPTARQWELKIDQLAPASQENEAVGFLVNIVYAVIVLLVPAVVTYTFATYTWGAFFADSVDAGNAAWAPLVLHGTVFFGLLYLMTRLVKRIRR